MKTSRTIHSFLLSQQEGQTLLTAQERPWSVLQVIPTTPADFDRTVAALKERGMVAYHDTDRTFCIIHLASGDHDGKHPERHIAAILLPTMCMSGSSSTEADSISQIPCAVCVLRAEAKVL